MDQICRNVELLSVRWPKAYVEEIIDFLPEFNVDDPPIRSSNRRNRDETESVNSSNANYSRGANSNRSFQTPRDVKKKRRLRKLRGDGRRQSAPPEVDRYAVAPPATPAAPPSGEKENQEQWNNYYNSFSERPIDCEGLDGLNANLERKGLGRMRAKSATPEKPMKKRRPLSLGNLYSLIRTKNNTPQQSKPTQIETTFGTENSRNRATNSRQLKFEYQTAPEPGIIEESQNMPRQQSESMTEADRFLENLTYENISTPISPSIATEYDFSEVKIAPKSPDYLGKLTKADSREDFRKIFAQGLWSAETSSPVQRKKSEPVETRIRSGTDPKQEEAQPEPVYGKLGKRYKSCDLLTETEGNKIDREMFNQYFNNTLSSQESGVASSGPCSSLSDQERHQLEVDNKYLEKTTTILREEFTISNNYPSALRERASSQPGSQFLSTGTDWSLDLAPCKPVISQPITTPNRKESLSRNYEVVVAIDFGTAYSGYAYAFKNDSENEKQNIFTMRRTEGGDPGLTNQKCPTCLLLTPDGKFHSFGYSARDFYHDLEPVQARNYLFFDQFKMVLHNQDLTQETLIRAANGHFWPAIEVFAHSLRFFKRRAILELSDRLGSAIDNQSIQWVVTVPTIWTQEARQLMREAAYQASLASGFRSQQLLIALEPEAAGLFCRELKLHEVAPDISRQFMSLPPSLRSEFKDQLAQGTLKAVHLKAGESYLVVDCGGGTTDITAHKVAPDGLSLVELTRASGGAFGSSSIDRSFETLLKELFTESFISEFHATYPAAWIDLMIAFESRKRSAHPYKLNPLNVALPFSFVDFHKKRMGYRVDHAVKKSKNPQVAWSSQENSDISCFTNCSSNLCVIPKYLFLVGGFAESPMVQHEIKKNFNTKLQVIIPQEQSVAVLKGAVLYGLYPNQITIRRSKLTYGIGVLNQFDPILHPPSKRIVKQGHEWCTDVFDIFVTAGEPLNTGDVIKRRYCPASSGQKEIVIQIYCTEAAHPLFVTDKGVRKCAMLRLALPYRQDSVKRAQESGPLHKREVEACMRFGETEIAVSAVEKETGAKIKCEIDFLSQ